MKLALAQINTTVGDLEGNIRRILFAARDEAKQGADLIAFPEMTVPGYPPRDILYDSSFVEAVQAATVDLAKQARGLPPLLVGSLKPSGEKLYQHPALHNVAYLMQKGEMQLAAVKRLLPVYDVFYEPRWFVAGTESLPPLEIAGTKVGFIICEDMWDEEYPVHPAQELKQMGAEMLVCISASPYRRGGGEERLHHAKRQGLPIAFVNLIGGNDELIFDGGSFWMDGERLEEVGRFDEKITLVDTRTPKSGDFGVRETLNAKSGDFALRETAEVFRALVLGVRDFARKNGMKHATLGLSGGIDSAVTAVIAAEALGAENVTGVAIPSRFTDPRSTESARELARALGIRFEVIGLEKMHLATETTLGSERSEGVGGENIQARLRMVILMSVVNQRGGFLLNTSNKTELTLGYGTLYGDLAGTLSPLGDVTKPDVYALARWINAKDEGGRMKDEALIPQFIIERKPSAELKPDQVDPFDYETVSPEMEKLVLGNQSNARMRASEHKRWQAGVILKVSGKSFGRGRMMPITRK
jgi:NAD+ synthase (glutamine-hydrolysing)